MPTYPLGQTAAFDDGRQRRRAWFTRRNNHISRFFRGITGGAGRTDNSSGGIPGLVIKTAPGAARSNIAATMSTTFDPILDAARSLPGGGVGR
jgi:hypothetical protein